MDGQFNPGYVYSRDASRGSTSAQQHASSTSSHHHSQQQSQAHQNGAPLAPYGSLSSHANQQQPSQHHNAHHPQLHPPHDGPGSAHTTLPPLQPTISGGFPFNNLNYAHHSQQGSTSTTSLPGSAIPAFASQTSPGAPPGAMLPPSPYTNQQYGLSQPLLYSASSNPPGSTAGLPTIQPRPPPALTNQMPGLSQLHMGQQPGYLHGNDDASQPTHVVGSQGRRGILPSAPGRPDVPTQGVGPSTKSMIPQKDADGKFPCPHCNKTYLHAKHLKRHLLRHTGDRPYMCHLCKDTFSRSDILKRHFNKCSIRRGNPTGANHLAHQRRNNNNNRLSISQQEGPIGLAGLPEVAGASVSNGTSYNGTMNNSPNANGDLSSARSSRANTISTAGNISHRNSIAGLGITQQPGPEQNSVPVSAHPSYVMPVAATVPSPSHAGYAAFSTGSAGAAQSVFPNSEPSSMSFLGQQSGRFDGSRNNSPHGHHQPPSANGSSTNGNAVEWHRIFNHTGQDGYMSGATSGQAHVVPHGIKPEVEAKHDFGIQHALSNDSFLGSLYSHPGAWSEYGEQDAGIASYPNWSPDDPLQAKVDSLMHFCFIDGDDGSPVAELIKKCLTPDMVKHLAEHYTSYHGHWPFLHMPTFKLTDAANGLVMAMLCIGAIYSPLLTNQQSRQMMEFIRSVVVRQSHVYNSYMRGHIEGLGSVGWHIEDFLALTIFHSMFTWHGEPRHRQVARDDFSTLCDIAKAMDLCQHASPGHYAYSQLHCLQNNTNTAIDAAGWNWHAWLEQEKRNRAMYLLFLTDVAMTMMFNAQTQFDPFQVRLMLPSDDAAWDASDENECAAALGLLGPHLQGRNRTGTRRPKQPGMREALRTLMEPSASFQPCTTNAYGKFILVHALTTRVITCQRAAFQPDIAFQSYGVAFGSSTPATPLSQNDWLEQRSNSVSGQGSGSISLNGSGQATPTDGVEHALVINQERKRLGHALDKWKRNWDQDMDMQYPPYPPSQPQLRRFGFSRDGVHFYYLAKSFLLSRRSTDWSAAPDVHFAQAMALLKRLKGHVIGDNDIKGQDLGSVGDIDAKYGVDDQLILDMKMLFRPFNSTTDSPVAGVRTYSL